MTCRLNGFVGGIDEAGRGPLAGPVVSACVIWSEPPCSKHGVNDSKILTDRSRRTILEWIRDNTFRIGIGIADHNEIDGLNIHKASLLSMERAFEDCSMTPDLLLIDGKFRPDHLPFARTVIKGDRKCFFIASASIVAKVVRDTMMCHLHELYPAYHFDKNKGYPTEDHKKAIGRFGITPVHRRTYKGVREYCENNG